MSSAVAGKPLVVEISTVPHIGLPLLLSVVTIVMGAAAYFARSGIRRLVAALLQGIGWGPDRGFDQAMRGLLRCAFGISRVVQSGRLDIYMKVTFVAIMFALIVPLAGNDEWPDWPVWPALQFYQWVVLLIAAAGLYAVVRAKNRLTAIVSLGIQGVSVALLFILLGAPDLSFTQFMIETLSVVILALVMTRLRLSVSDWRPVPERVFDAVVAAAIGAGFGLLLLRVTQVPFDARLSDFFSTYSRAIAHGRNIVNVIIVDFRGLDTLGEISVVMIAGLAILALIRMTGRRTAAKEKA